MQEKTSRKEEPCPIWRWAKRQTRKRFKNTQICRRAGVMPEHKTLDISCLGGHKSGWNEYVCIMYYQLILIIFFSLQILTNSKILYFCSQILSYSKNLSQKKLCFIGQEFFFCEAKCILDGGSPLDNFIVELQTLSPGRRHWAILPARQHWSLLPRQNC